MKRIEANDPVAICHLGSRRQQEGDYKSAFEYWSKAAELGDVDAHYKLSILYSNGLGVGKDEKKKFYYAEEAAIGGHPLARHNLGCAEEGKDRAVKHWIIAANLGNDMSMEILKKGFKKGMVSKEDFAAALRAHQAAVDATKSPQREKGEAAKQRWR